MGFSIVYENDDSRLYVSIEKENLEAIAEVFVVDGEVRIAIPGPRSGDHIWVADLTELENALAEARAALRDRGLID